MDILFRVNAGLNVGLGHISRCMQIARKMARCYPISFMVNTDSKEIVENFIRDIANNLPLNNLIYVNKDNDLSVIIDYYHHYHSFLVLDHYDVDEEYQLILKRAGMHWLQLDSHAAQLFYGDFVQHGSPGATEELYANLHGNKETKFLLGPQYVIVNEELTELHNSSKVRETIRKVFVSFGGGYAKGALLKYLSVLVQSFPSLEFCVALRANHPDLLSLKHIEKDFPNVTLYIDSNYVYQLMCQCDVAILASGGMSYEAATVGLPSILIALEDNQFVNLKGCSDLGISVSLGTIDLVPPNTVVNTLMMLKNNTELLSRMSKVALHHFDGKGVNRIVSVINMFLMQL